ncbi:MAG TPA: YbaB/EbfC family nucleoid-associated protein [bacterium]|nr:YbaB/EbfC family nucleoid-associated protein [bacterium]
MDYGQAQELMKLQQEAARIKEKLGNTHIEAEVDGVVVTVNGEMQVVSTVIEDTSLLSPSNKEKLQKAFTDAANKGIKKAQEVAAEEMRAMMGGLGMNLPGMQ